MNDQDLIQRNQILIMRTLACMIRHMPMNYPIAQKTRYCDALWNASTETKLYIDAKEGRAPFPKMHDTVITEAIAATETNPWPADLDGIEKEQWR